MALVGGLRALTLAPTEANNSWRGGLLSPRHHHSSRQWTSGYRRRPSYPQSSRNCQWIATPEHGQGSDMDSHLEADLEKQVQLKLVEQQQLSKGHLNIDPPQGGQDVVQVGVRVVDDAV